MQSPYKALPQLGELEDAILRRLAQDGDLSEQELRLLVQDGSQDDEFDAETQINNGGFPLVLYRYLQTFADSPDPDRDITLDEVASGKLHIKTISEALYRYCELDTMAMVLIWEYFAHECGVIK